MIEKLLLIGGGGHCRSILDSIHSAGNFDEIAIVDIKEKIGKSIMGHPVVGSDEDLQALFEKGFSHAFISLGSIENPESRVRLYSKIESIGFVIPNIIDKTAIIGQDVTFDNGIFIGKNAVVNFGTIIGKGAIINTSATIEHECIIGAFTHIAPGSILCGRVTVGEQTHIGAGSIIKQMVSIGKNSIVGMGSVVVKDINEQTVAFGNPCKEVKKL